MTFVWLMIVLQLFFLMVMETVNHLSEQKFIIFWNHMFKVIFQTVKVYRYLNKSQTKNIIHQFNCMSDSREIILYFC